MSTRATRVVAAVAALEGLTLLGRPVQTTAALGLGEAPPPTWLVRVLGARRLVQHAALVVAPGRTAARLAVVTELAHAASMLPAALLWPGHRRAALTSVAGAVAAALAVGLVQREDADADPDGLWADPTG